MLLRSIKSLDFGSITLEVSRSEEDNNNIRRLGIVNASFTQAVSKVEDMNKELEDLRIRIVASYDKKSSQLIDYATQRSNEYLFLEKQNPLFRLDPPANEYISFLRQDLGNSASVLSESQPFSPYSTERSVIPNMFRDAFSTEDVLPGTIYYDIPLINTLPRDQDGQIIRRQITGTDPAVISDLPEEQLANPNTNWGEIFIQLVSRVSTQTAQKVYLEPVQFDFSGLTDGDLEQLTFYMFVYDSKFAEPGQDFNLPEISLVTGMSFSRTANVIGERTVWPRMAPEKPYPTIGKLLPDGNYQDTVIVNAPEAIIFQRIDLNPQGVIIERVNSMFDRVYGRLARSILDSKPEIKKVIKKDNFFSDLWVTKDSDENNRFMFAFDLESNLIANSYFPFLYRSPNISNQLINSTGLMSGPDSDPSRVLMMNVTRRMVDEDSDTAINDLGTMGGRKPLGPNRTFREKTIGEATPVENIYLNPDNSRSVKNKTIFYEGRDSLTDPTKESPNKYEVINTDVIYGVEYVVYDAAPIFMRNMIKFLTNRKSLVTEVFDTIVNSVPTSGGYQGGIVKDGRDLYNPVTLALNVPLSNIAGVLDGRVQIFETALLDAILEYQRMLDDLVPFEFESGGIDIRAFYQNEFQKNDGLIDPLVIKDIEKLMDIGIQLIYRKLTEFFPNDPMGRGLDVSIQSNLERRGFCQRKVPLVRGEYYFDTTKSEGKTFGFGSDFIFRRESDSNDFDGLTRISIEEYIQRVNNEFEKYFSSYTPGLSVTPVGSYEAPAYGYMTPNIIRTPGRNEAQSTTRITPTPGTPVIGYNLDVYAQIFADIANLRYFIENRQTNPSAIGRYSQLQLRNGALYDSVIEALEEQHGVEINYNVKPQYRVPSIMTGETLPTVGDNFSRSYISIFRNGPLAIPTLIGGENNTNPDVITFLDSIDNTLSQTDPDRSKGTLDREIAKRELEERPIKLPFAILGELTVDKILDFSTDYEDKEFNSLREFTNTTEITRDSLIPVLQNTFVSALPNQVKSAIIVSTTDDRLDFGNENITFDARRPILIDQDPGEEKRLISFAGVGEAQTPYFKTYDPMKIYAKFLTFWMNYKQIAKIEYLDSFGDLGAPRDFYSDLAQLDLRTDESTVDKAKLPQWRLLSPDIIQNTKDNLLCRVRMMSPKDYIDILALYYKEPVLSRMRKYFERKESLEMPIYNKYFLLDVNAVREETQDPPPRPKYPTALITEEQVESDSVSVSLAGLVGAGFAGEE
jgi:hypothetical protein